MDKRLQTALYSLAGLIVVAAALILISAHQKPKSPTQEFGDNWDKPRGVSIDPSGNVYVVDSRHHRIEKRSLGGVVIKRFGKMGFGDGQFKEPCGITTDKQGNIYVADTFYTMDPKGIMPPWGRIEKFSSDGTFVASWGKGPEQGELFGPRDVAVDSAGNVYLSDTGNHRIIKYASNGSYIKAWGKRGSGQGEFIEPFGLAFDKQDRLYVADRLNYRIQVFDTEGNFIRQWKVNGWEESQINMEPYLAIDKEHGWIYVSDPTKQKVHRYDLSGGKHKEYTQAADGTPFNLPTGLAVNPSDGTVLVTNGGSGRLSVLQP